MTRKTLSQTARRIVCTLLGVLFFGTGILVVCGLQDQLGHADVALVLGSKVELDGVPSKRLQARLDRTVELYQAGYFPCVIASGGFGKEGYDEAVVMKAYLVAHGIPSEDVIVDGHGDTTFASAQNTQTIAREHGFRSVFVVTQYFHIPRSRLALQRFGFTTLYSAHAHIYELRDVFSSIRESFGYVSYLLRRYD